jgi:predicted RND superfamily exporter protein
VVLLVGDRRLPGEAQAERALGGVPNFGAGPGTLSLRHPRFVLMVTVAMVAVLVAFARSLDIDYDLLKFLPPGAESVTAQRDLSAPPPNGSDFGTDVVVVTADSVAAARKLAAELAARPNVGRVESIASFLPADQPEKLAAVAPMRPLVETIPPFAPPQPPTTPDALRKSLIGLEDAIDDAEALAERQGNPLTEPLKNFSSAIGGAIRTLHELPPDEAQHRVAVIEEDVFSLLIRVRALLRENVLDARPVTLDDLPRATRERFVGRSGKMAIYVFQKHVETGPALQPFVDDVRAVAPNATGFPIIYYDSSRAVWPTFQRAALQALAVIVIAVLLHFRSVSAAALSLVPLAIGAVAMLGLMRVFDVPVNIANIVALPLLIGLGTDYGLQIIHHRRTVPDEPLPEVLRKTGLGVFMAGGSTAAGFGALALARHLGARSLGLVLFLGTSAALACSLIVLPAILCLLDRRRARPTPTATTEARSEADPYLLIPNPPTEGRRPDGE